MTKRKYACTLQYQHGDSSETKKTKKKFHVFDYLKLKASHDIKSGQTGKYSQYIATELVPLMSKELADVSN